MAAPAIPKDLATALAYGAGSQQKIKRSEYLAEALRQISQSGNQPIRGGWGELAADLGAAWLTKRASDKANKEALDALNQDRSAYADTLLTALKGDVVDPPSAPAAPAASAQPASQTLSPAAPPVVTGPLATATPPAGQAPSLWPALERQESGGRQSAVSPKGAFGVAQLMPGTAADMAAAAGDPALAQRARTDPDVNRQLGQQYLQQQLDAYQVPEMALAAYNAGPGRVDEWIRKYGDPRKGEISPQAWAQQIPFPETRDYVSRVLSGAQPSPAMGAPAATPVPMGPAPAPQGAPAAPPGGQAAPGAGYWRPNARQVSYVEGLLSNPRTYDEGVRQAQALRQKMQEPIKYKIQVINNLPFYVPEDPSQGAGLQPIPVPPEAMTQIMSAQAAGAQGAPAGVNVQRDPMGNVREVPGAPPQGYQLGPDGGYAPIRGGPADPQRQQAPPQGYQWQGAGMAPVQGGPNDPKSPTALFEGTKGLRAEIAPVVNQATQLKRNVDSVRQGFAQQNGPGDIAMVNGLQRLIDEGVVREGDVALQLKGQGIQGGIAGLKGYMTGEGFFADPVVRRKVLNAAESLYGEINGTYRERVMGYRGIADRIYGPGTFDDYVLPGETAQALGWSDKPQDAGVQPAPSAPVADFTPGSVDAAIALAVKRGMTNTLSPRQQARARELGLIHDGSAAATRGTAAPRVRRYNPQTGRLEP